MKEKDDLYLNYLNFKEDFKEDFEDDFELIKKNKKNNGPEIEKLKQDLGYAPAPGVANDYLNLNLNLNLNIDNIIKEKNNNNKGIIQKPLNILVLDGTNSITSNSVSDAILNNGLNNSKFKFPQNQVVCTCEVVGGNGAKVTRILCESGVAQYGIEGFEWPLVDQTYDVIVVTNLNLNSYKYILDGIALRISMKNDGNLIVYGDNYLSNEVNMNWFKYHLPYEFGCKNLLQKIALFDESTRKFVGWDGKDKDNPNYEQNRVDGLKNTYGAVFPKIAYGSKSGSSGRALNVLKNHYGKIAAVVVLLEEIFLGKIRKNLPKFFESKETEKNKKNKENKEHKSVEENKSANNDVGKEKAI